MDRDVGSLVVQRDVAAGHRDTESLAALRDTTRCLRELPHDTRVLRRTEVQAVRDRQRARTGRPEQKPARHAGMPVAARLDTPAQARRGILFRLVARQTLRAWRQGTD